MDKKKLLLFAVFVISIAVIIQASSAKEILSYTAYYEEPCGRSLLVLKSPGQESIAVQAKGVSPIHELKHSVLVNTKFHISGYFTGRQIDDQHCGNYPEFYVTEYSAAGPVTRCTSVANWVMYEIIELYPPGMPKNKLIDIDFEKHRSLLKEVPLSQCRRVDKETVCSADQTPATVCGHDIHWCCLNKS